MTTIKIRTCDKCGRDDFETKKECLIHENSCVPVTFKICHKCGKAASWDFTDDEVDIVKSNQWYNINLGQMGYGSKLDGNDVNFVLCDDCLSGLIDSLYEYE